MNISTYKRTGTYTLKDGTVKPTSYVIRYARKLPKYTTHKKVCLRKALRKNIQTLQSGEMLDKFNYFVCKLTELNIDEAIDILGQTEDLLKAKIKILDNTGGENTPPVAIAC